MPLQSQELASGKWEESHASAEWPGCGILETVSFEGCCELPSGSVELCASNRGQRSWHVASGLTAAKAGIFEPRKLRTPGSLEEHNQQNEYLL